MEVPKNNISGPTEPQSPLPQEERKPVEEKVEKEARRPLGESTKKLIKEKVHARLKALVEKHHTQEKKAMGTDQVFEKKKGEFQPEVTAAKTQWKRATPTKVKEEKVEIAVAKKETQESGSTEAPSNLRTRAKTAMKTAQMWLKKDHLAPLTRSRAFSAPEAFIKGKLGVGVGLSIQDVSDLKAEIGTFQNLQNVKNNKLVTDNLNVVNQFLTEGGKFAQFREYPRRLYNDINEAVERKNLTKLRDLSEDVNKIVIKDDDPEKSRKEFTKNSILRTISILEGLIEDNTAKAEKLEKKLNTSLDTKEQRKDLIHSYLQNFDKEQVKSDLNILWKLPLNKQEEFRGQIVELIMKQEIKLDDKKEHLKALLDITPPKDPFRDLLTKHLEAKP